MTHNFVCKLLYFKYSLPPSLTLVIHTVRYMHAYKHAFIDTKLTVVVILTPEVGATHSETALLHADGSHAASLT